MAVITVKTAILVSRPLTRTSFVLNLHQDLDNRGSQRSEACEPPSGGFGTFILSPFSGPSHISSLILPCVLLSFPLLQLLLSSQQRIFLVLILGVKHCVLLAQLLLQFMILLGEAFYCCCESLNLSLKGSGAWFVPLIVIGGHHRASKYHATFCPRSSNMAFFLSTFPHRRCQLMMPKIVSKPYSLTCSKQNLRNKDEEKTLQRAPVWCRPKILRRLSQRIFTTLECQNLGQLCVPCFLRLRVFIVVQNRLLFLGQKDLSLQERS